MSLKRQVSAAHGCARSAKPTSYKKIPKYCRNGNADLKGHGNELSFPSFLHKSLWPRSLTLYFEPFRFWLRIRGDIRIGKMTPHIGESGSQQDCL
jgi:hypothetical protein